MNIWPREAGGTVAVPDLIVSNCRQPLIGCYVLTGKIRSYGFFLPIQDFANPGFTDAERIEVVKRASSAICGQLEPGAMINAVTKDPEKLSLPNRSVRSLTQTYSLAYIWASTSNRMSKWRTAMSTAPTSYSQPVRNATSRPAR